MNIIYGALELGLIYGIAALGIYLTLRIVDFPDLTVNGSFVLGAATSSVMIIKGADPFFATLCAMLIGGAAGAMTAFVSLKFKIQNLLAGIIVMIGLYSINMRIMGGPNLVILDNQTVFLLMSEYPVIMTFFISATIFIILSWILTSEIGLAFRAAGQNQIIGESYGMNYNFAVTSVMILSNALVALSGSLFSQLNGFSDVNMGNYTIVIGLASVIIGERLWPTRNIPVVLLLCILGSIIYQLIISAALSAKDGAIFKTSDIYLITSVLVIIMMATRRKGL